MLCTAIQTTIAPANQAVWDEMEDCDYFEDWTLVEPEKEDYSRMPSYYAHIGMAMTDLACRQLEDGSEILLKRVNATNFYAAWVQYIENDGQITFWPLDWEVALVIFPQLEGLKSFYAMVDPFYEP